jgi:transposase
MVRKKFSASFKAQVALEVIKNELTLAEIAQKYQVHPTQIKDWKAQLIAKAEDVFNAKGKKEPSNDGYVEALERKAGQLAIEIDFLKKNLHLFHKRNG